MAAGAGRLCGVALGVRGRHGRRLGPGLETAHSCGAVGLVLAARDELKLAGVRARRMVLSGRDALTPAERRVAELARDGMRNTEIAQILFVTLRTVEMHLSSAYRKLDISSRDDLPSALADA